MAKEEKKKPLSFSDFTDDDFGSTIDDNLDVDGSETDDVDDDLEDTTKKPEKKIDKKQSKQKADPINQDQDNDDSDPDEDLEDKDKKKVDPKAPKKDVKPTDTDPETGDDEDVDPAKFFEEVEKVTGLSVDVDYGDVHPLTPQGIALRDKALKDAVLDGFLEEMEGKYPQAFKALKHAYNGGDITELFSQTLGRDYSKVEIKETDNDLAKEVLKEYYKKRGVKNESKILKMIEADEDSDNGLIKEAQNALAELAEEQEKERSEIVERQARKEAEQKKKDQIFVAAVDEVLESKRLGSFRIPDRTEAQEFKKFVLSSLRRTETGYELATTLNPNELSKQLQAAYFQFKKGDLSKIIQEKAVTENTKKLQFRLSNEQSKAKKTTEQESKTGISMKDFY
jgi:hypothetical protein